MCRSVDALIELSESLGGWAWQGVDGGWEVRCGCEEGHIFWASGDADDADYYERRAADLRSCSR